MSVENIKNVFNEFNNNCDFCIKLLKCEINEEGNVNYELFPIVLSTESMEKYTKRIIKKYIENSKSVLNDKIFDEYTGENDYTKLVKVDKRFIEKNLDRFLASVEDCDHEDNWEEYIGGYVLEINNNYFVSLISPIKAYKNIIRKGRNNVFTDCNETFLSLSDRFDIFVIGNDIFFASQKAEDFFDMESTFINMRNQAIEKIENCAIISDIGKLKEFSSKKRYTKYYVNFKNERLTYFSNKSYMKKIAKKFNIKLINEKVNADDLESLKNFVRFICNKGMIDPCNLSAVEVSNAKEW